MSKKTNRVQQLTKFSAIFVVVGLWTLLAAISHPISTAASPAGGITVTPARLNLSLSKDAPSQRVTVSVTNNYDVPVALTAEFKGIDEDAGILVPDNNLEAPLATALKLSETDVRLLPHQPYQLTIQLDNAAALAPGGHYATLVLTQQPSPGNGLSLHAAVSLAIFAVKAEGLHRSFEVTSFTTNGWLFRMPSVAKLSYHNTGNVHVVPRAEVAIVQPNNFERLRRGSGNQNSVLVLPGKNWTDTIQVKGLQNVWLPKKLQVIAAYRSDGELVPHRLVRTSWYVPPLYPLALLAIIFLVLRRKRQWLLKIGVSRMVSASIGRAAFRRSAQMLATIIRYLKPRARPLQSPGELSTPEPVDTELADPAEPVIAPQKKKAIKSSKTATEKPKLSLADLEKRTTQVKPKKTKTAKPRRPQAGRKTQVTKPAAKTRKKPASRK